MMYIVHVVGSNEKTKIRSRLQIEARSELQARLAAIKFMRKHSFIKTIYVEKIEMEKEKIKD